MLLQEFNNLIEKGIPQPTIEEYRIIEEVYSWHPSISETEGKKQIALLYNNFGMTVINDMLRRADYIKYREIRIESLKVEIKRLEKEIETYV